MLFGTLSAFIVLGGIAIAYRLVVEAIARRYGRRVIPLGLIVTSLLFAGIGIVRLQGVESAGVASAATRSPLWMAFLLGAFFFVALIPLTVRMLVIPVPASGSTSAARAAAAVLWLVSGLLLVIVLGTALEMSDINFLPPLSPIEVPSGAV